MLYTDFAPDTINQAPRRKFVGSRFDRFMLGLSGTDEYGNTTAWGRAKGVVLPAVYGTLGAVGTTIAGLGPGVGAKFGSQLGAGINSLTNRFGSTLLSGTDGLDDFNEQRQKSGQQAQTTAGALSTLTGLADKSKILNAPAGGGVAATPGAQNGLGGGAPSAETSLLTDLETDPMEVYKQNMRRLNFGQIMFRGGGEAPVWVRTLKALGQTGQTGFNGKVYNLDNLSTSEPSSTSVMRPQTVISPVLERIAGAENSRYDQQNNVGPGHFGKYQFEPMLIEKYAGVTPQQFLRNPELQELAMRRRLGDLRMEAQTAIQKTQSPIPLEDAMLMVHFKGMGQAMKEMQNPELMDRPTRRNPSTNRYLVLGSRFNNSPVGMLGRTIQNLFRSGGETKEPVRVYGDSDDTEDYFMVDKEVAKQVGLEGTLNTISWGQGRYGERFFDQKSNAFMKDVLRSNRTAAEKKRILGQHVFTEIQTHEDFQNGSVRKFAGGGVADNPREVFEKQKDQYLERINVALENLNDFEARMQGSTKPSDVDSNKYREFLLRQKEKLQLLEYGKSPYAALGAGSVGADDLKAVFEETEPVITGKFIRDPELTGRYNQEGRDLRAMGGGPVRKFTPSPLKPLTWDEFVGAKPAATPAPKTELPPIEVPRTTQPATPGVVDGIGGRTTVPAPTVPTANAYAFDPTATAEVTNAQRRMNQLGSTLLPNFKPLAQDGKWGESTEMVDRQLQARLGNVYRITNDRVVVPTPDGPKVMVTGASTNDPDLMTPKLQYGAMGISGQTGVLTPKQLGQVAATRMNQSLAQTGITKQTPPVPTDPTALNKLGEISGYLPDLGRLIVGGTLARANQPGDFKLGQEYFRMKSEVENRRNAGLLPEQRAQFTNQLGSVYAGGTEALRSTVAGGANMGLLVSGLGRLGQQYQNGLTTLANMDNQQRQQNYNTYMNFMGRDLGIRQGLFNREEGFKAANRQAGGALMGAALQNAQDRYDYNQQYGPGSQYGQLQSYISDIYKQTLATQQAQAEAFNRRLAA